MKAALYYGTRTGNTEDAAEMIRDEFGEDFFESFGDIARAGVEELVGYDLILCGVPTWDIGEIQEDWQDIVDRLDDIDLTGTTIAMFGVGDQVGYPETFQDAIGMVYTKMLERGATGRIGFTDPSTYSFDESKGLIDGRFCGLALDNDTQPELTGTRIRAWVAQLRQELDARPGP